MENSIIRSVMNVQRPSRVQKKDYRNTQIDAPIASTYSSRHLRGLPRGGHRIPKRRDSFSVLEEQWESYESRAYSSNDSGFVSDKSHLASTQCSDGYLCAASQLVLLPGKLEWLHNLRDSGIPTWDMIAQCICLVTKDTECPICLHPPVFPRMERCGHIYCGPCAVQYVKYDNEGTSKKCAVCSWVLRLEDMKRASLTCVSTLSVGSSVELQLVKRHQSSHGMESTQPIIGASEHGHKQFQYIQEISEHDFLVTVQDEIESLEAYKVVCLKEDDVELIPSINHLIDEVKCELSNAGSTVANASSSVDFTPQSTDKGYEIVDSAENLSTTIVCFYQASDGQAIYLDGLMWACLMTEFEDVSQLPNPLNVKITSIKSFRMSPVLRKRWHHLSHIPIGYAFSLIGIELEPLVSGATLNKFATSLQQRSIEQDRLRIEDLRLTTLKEAAENRIPTLPEGFTLSGYADLSNPLNELSGQDSRPYSTSNSALKPKSSTASFAEITKTGALSVVDRNRVANFTRSPNQPIPNVFDLGAEFWPSLSESMHIEGACAASPPRETIAACWPRPSAMADYCATNNSSTDTVSVQDKPILGETVPKTSSKRHRKRRSHINSLLD